MTQLFYQFLDWFFIVFHTGIILFNLFGWIWKKTRRANLILLLLTGASWGILGIWYGFGYCPFTDWHWAVLRNLGQQQLPVSYIRYLIDRVTGIDFSEGIVISLTLIFYLIALAVSLFVNFRKVKQNSRS